MSVADLVARVCGMTGKKPMDSAGRILVEFHRPGYCGGTSPLVLLDPCWERLLARLVAHLDAVRVEHHCVLSQPDDRHAQPWRARVGQDPPWLG